MIILPLLLPKKFEREGNTEPIIIKKIEIINKDTYPKKNKFFSSRRSINEKFNDYGRNISVIMIK